jgi:hypothetical protein
MDGPRTILGLFAVAAGVALAGAWALVRLVGVAL